MKKLIAQKYAQALAGRADLAQWLPALGLLAQVVRDARVGGILEANFFSRKKKLGLILSFFEGEKIPQALENFLRLLGAQGRLDCLGEIYELVKKNMEADKNASTGQVSSQAPLDKRLLAELEQSLGQRLGVKIKLENKLRPAEGIKITLEELGYELSFSMAALRERLGEDLLKII